MQRRIFIGIDLPPHTKKRLMEKKEEWNNLPIKWSREENLHMTLSFVGFINENELAEVCEIAREVGDKSDAFDIAFDEIVVAPDEKNPKMLWLKGKAPKEFQKLQEEITKKLGTYVGGRKRINLHVTLGRIERGKWQKLEEKPVINESVKIAVSADAIDVFESTVVDGKRTFVKLESCPLG